MTTDVNEWYWPGQILHVRDAGDLKGKGYGRAIVDRVLPNPTCSVCLIVNTVVDIKDGVAYTEPEPLFLKLYDPRCANLVREQVAADEYTPAMERRFQAEVRDGSMAQLVAEAKSYDNASTAARSKYCRNLTPSQREALVYHRVRRDYNKEAAAYDAMKDIQGEFVPRKLYEVAMPRCPESDEDGAGDDELLNIFGIVLEHTPGFKLKEAPQREPQSEWQNLFDAAIRANRAVRAAGVVSLDAHDGNFLVCTTADNRYAVMAIDFGSCIIREPNESDEEWGETLYQIKDNAMFTFYYASCWLQDRGFKLQNRRAEDDV